MPCRYDKHLYALDYNHGTLFQWRDADRAPEASQQQQKVEQPRVHLGATYTSGEEKPAVSKAAATVAQPPARSRLQRIRAAMSNQ